MVYSGSAITDFDQKPDRSARNGGKRDSPGEELDYSIIDDTETVHGTVTNHAGLTRIGDEIERTVDCPVEMAVTDRRILFAEAGSDEAAADAGALPYGKVAAIDVAGTGDERLVISMESGDRWEFPLPESDAPAVDEAVRHLRWVGEVRRRIVACRNDLELEAGRIREAADRMDWDDARDRYGAVRERLDRLIGAVQWTTPIDDDVLAPELTEMERTIEGAYAHLHIERAESQLALGTQLVDSESYDRARTVLGTAQDHADRARQRADAVERGDAFRFGEQRQLREELDRLRWEIEAVSAEPLLQAHEAKIRAETTDDPAEAIDHWEAAFRRYGNVLALEWGDEDRHFVGDHDEIREEMARAAGHLVDHHRELASAKWDRGVAREEAGEIKAAIRTCDEATDHLDRARELAAEFQPAAVDGIEDRLDRMTYAVATMRETADVPDSDDERAPDPPEPPMAEPEGAAEALRAIDTHHEITLETTLEEGAAGGGRVALTDETRAGDTPEHDPEPEDTGRAGEPETEVRGEAIDAE
jgi:tetratricopeptide (TPR) repeat protein